MSILGSDIQTLTMDCFYEKGSIAWGVPNLGSPELENMLIEAFYSCDPDKWIPEYIERVKSLLNAQSAHVNMDDHPFDNAIKQVWVDFAKNVFGVVKRGNFVLYVSKKNQPGDTELVAYGAGDTMFTLSMMRSLQQGKQARPALQGHP